MGAKVTLAAAQMGPGSEDKGENLQRVLALLAECNRRGVDIACLPELCLTTYFPARYIADLTIYFDTLQGQSLNEILGFTRDTGMAVILPLAEYDGLYHFNSAAVIQGGSILGLYRKLHLPGAFLAERNSCFERLYFKPGDLGLPAFDVKDCRIGVQICYDRMFPEGYRCLTLAGARLIFNPANVPGWRGDISWDRLLQARAFENGVFVVGVNKGGREHGVDFLGRSQVISPWGEPLAVAASLEDEVVAVTVDLDEVDAARRRLPYLRDRREEAYGLLTQTGRQG